jgi:glycosyltransferase involved in cell wall biosynthesis
MEKMDRLSDDAAPGGQRKAAAGPQAAVKVSVVIPAYDEEESIEACVAEVKRAMDPLRTPYEILVVDDGSRDGTAEILRRLRQSIPNLRAVRFVRNAGQTAALDAGFKEARGSVVVTLDADMQNDPADIPVLLDMLNEWDVVCGIRRKRQDSLVRRISSRIGNGFRNWVTHENIRDVGCTLRAFRADCLRGVKLYTGMHRFLPTLLKLEGCRVAQVPVNHRPRRLGKTKYGIKNRLFKGLRDVLAVRWMQSRWLRYQIAERIE